MIDSKYRKQIETVKNILLQYNEECRINFVKNLETLTINNSRLMSKGNYNPEKNIIVLDDDLSLCHELFHMAFNNTEQFGKEVLQNFYIDNGISLKSENGIFGHALTEGFAEYLNRKCNSNKGKHFEYYFADLLISIYGEEILEYALENNPIGFLECKKFNNIVEYISELDQLEEIFKNVKFVAASLPLIEEANKRNEESILTDFRELSYSIRIGIPSVTLDLFNTIIEEYNSCEDPKIDNDQFIQKIELFCEDEEYDAVFRLSSNKELKNEILKLREKINLKKEK